jgi:hypothetical protein
MNVGLAAPGKSYERSLARARLRKNQALPSGEGQGRVNQGGF